MFELGDTWALTAEAKLGGVLTNATTAVLTVTLPDLTSTAPSVTNTGTGLYAAAYTPAQVGRHEARWLFTYPTATDAYTDVLDVAPAAPGGIVSLADAKAHLNITTTTHDDELRGWIASVTEVIEGKVGPVVVRSYTERVGDGPSWWLEKTPAVSLTSVTAVLTAGTVVTVAELDLHGAHGRVRRLDGAALTGGPWTVVYKAGRVAPPANIGHAARIILKHLWDTQRGGAGKRPTMGGEDTTYDPSFGFSIPRRAVELLEPHMLGQWAR